MSESIFSVISGLYDIFKENVQTSVSGNKKEKITKVAVPPAWSTFDYLVSPLDAEFDDEEPGIYFTIPCGYQIEDDILKYWFIRFNTGSVNDIDEYFLNFNYKDIV